MAGTAALQINQGETYTFALTVTGANYTGATAKLQFRDQPGGAVLYDTFTSPAGGLVISTSVGGSVPDTITLTISAARSAAYTFTGAFYDVLVTLSDATAKRPIQGAVYISKQVTV